MKNLLPLMQREWLQHRFAWAMLVLVPVALAVLGLGIGTIQLDDEMQAMPGPQLALMLGAISMSITVVVLFLLLSVTSLFIALGSPRRDHGDRSIEFWLSLPSGHGESLAAPMLVHLLLVPVAALFVGMLAALPVSLIVVARVEGLGAWFALPWPTLLAGLLTLVARVAAGLPLAVAWMLPLLLAAMLANALFRRWGLPLLAVALLVLAWLLERVFGQPLLADTLGHVGLMAARSLVGAGADGIVISSEVAPEAMLGMMPRLALQDFGAALAQLPQPMFAGTLLVSALLFGALVVWRRQGASAA
jgi:ABC-2 type transport system permease protein